MGHHLTEVTHILDLAKEVTIPVIASRTGLSYARVYAVLRLRGVKGGSGSWQSSGDTGADEGRTLPRTDQPESE